MFCTGGYDGKVIIYSAMKGEVVTSYQLGSSTLAKNINVVRYNCSGTKVSIILMCLIFFFSNSVNI